MHCIYCRDVQLLHSASILDFFFYFFILLQLISLHTKLLFGLGDSYYSFMICYWTHKHWDSIATKNCKISKLAPKIWHQIHAMKDFIPYRIWCNFKKKKTPKNFDIALTWNSTIKLCDIGLHLMTYIQQYTTKIEVEIKRTAMRLDGISMVIWQI